MKKELKKELIKLANRNYTADDITEITAVV